MSVEELEVRDDRVEPFIRLEVADARLIAAELYESVDINRRLAGEGGPFAETLEAEAATAETLADYLSRWADAWGRS